MFTFGSLIRMLQLEIDITSKSIWSTMCIIEPPPSHGLIRYPLGSISALTKCGTAGMLGPPRVPLRDLSQTCLFHDWSKKERRKKGTKWNNFIEKVQKGGFRGESHKNGLQSVTGNERKFKTDIPQGYHLPRPKCSAATRSPELAPMLLGHKAITESSQIEGHSQWMYQS